MADTFNKKEREKKKRQRKKAKEFKRDTRKENPTTDTWENMIVYVDENGTLQDTPPDPSAKKEIKAKQIEIGIPKREDGDVDFELRGVINYFDESKGYGFIKTENDENFFVHQNNISGPAEKGQKVLVTEDVAKPVKSTVVIPAPTDPVGVVDADGGVFEVEI